MVLKRGGKVRKIGKGGKEERSALRGEGGEGKRKSAFGKKLQLRRGGDGGTAQLKEGERDTLLAVLKLGEKKKGAILKTASEMRQITGTKKTVKPFASKFGRKEIRVLANEAEGMPERALE